MHLLTNNMLFVTNNANCISYTHHIKELFCSPKEKDLTRPPNLTLMTVIIYTEYEDKVELLWIALLQDKLISITQDCFVYRCQNSWADAYN